MGPRAQPFALRNDDRLAPWAPRVAPTKIGGEQSLSAVTFRRCRRAVFKVVWSVFDSVFGAGRSARGGGGRLRRWQSGQPPPPPPESPPLPPHPPCRSPPGCASPPARRSPGADASQRVRLVVLIILIILIVLIVLIILPIEPKPRPKRPTKRWARPQGPRWRTVFGACVCFVVPPMKPKV
eukprot:73216-Pyramimonas_sp.AAC.1